MPRGALIVLEGCDKCGKTTQSQLLVKNLTNQRVQTKRISFPYRRTDIGAMLDCYLRNKIDVDSHAIHLIFSANRWEMRNEILKQLRDGVTLVVDRYAFSGAAYTAAKGEIPLAWCKQADTGLPKPDVVFFLDLVAESAKRRDGYGDERYDNPDFQSKVRDVYKQLKDDTWKFVNADQSVENVQAELLDFALKKAAEVQSEPIGTLWT